MPRPVGKDHDVSRLATTNGEHGQYRIGACRLWSLMTLTGRVLPVGGLREKVVAARRSGQKVLIFPDGNRSDYERLPDHLRQGLGGALRQALPRCFENRSRLKRRLTRNRPTGKRANLRQNCLPSKRWCG